MPIVQIDGIGQVEFPDSMSQEDIASTIKTKLLPAKQPVPRGNPGTIGPYNPTLMQRLHDTLPAIFGPQVQPPVGQTRGLLPALFEPRNQVFENINPAPQTVGQGLGVLGKEVVNMVGTPGGMATLGAPSLAALGGPRVVAGLHNVLRLAFAPVAAKMLGEGTGQAIYGNTPGERVVGAGHAVLGALPALPTKEAGPIAPSAEAPKPRVGAAFPEGPYKPNAPEPVKPVVEPPSPFAKGKLMTGKQPLPENAFVMIQQPQEIAPGVKTPPIIQVQLPEGNIKGTHNPEALQAAGYDVPSSAELLKLPQGRYSLAQVKEQLNNPTGRTIMDPEFAPIRHDFNGLATLDKAAAQQVVDFYKQSGDVPATQQLIERLKYASREQKGVQVPSNKQAQGLEETTKGQAGQVQQAPGARPVQSGVQASEPGGQRQGVGLGGQGDARGANAASSKNAQEIVPALRIKQGKGWKTVLGKQGQSHDELVKQHGEGERGFWLNGQFLNREQAARETGLPTTEEPGKLHSQDLPGSVQKMDKTGEAGFVIAPPAMWKSLFQNASTKVDPGQMFNRIKNVLGEASATFEALQAAGLKGFLSQPRSVQEVKDWAEKNGPRVEVRKFGEGNITPQQKEWNQLTHEIETSGYGLGIRRGAGVYLSRQGLAVPWEELPPEIKPKLDRLQELNELIKMDDRAPNWQSIAPKSEQDMPGYVEGAVVIPVKPQPISGTIANFEDALQSQAYYESIKFPVTHNFPPNTLGFFRGYMETLPSGKKVFHVIEVQSDWAQQKRELTQTIGNSTSNPERFNEPLLKDYERLVLKAAIEHAKAEGADAIAISDAETAMMTEGHDRAAIQGRDVIGQMEDGGMLPQISQEPGMRLHYDKTLPKIAEELTGSKGEKVSFGEHKMAFDTGPERPTAVSNPRSDLIFRNEQGLPKTDVSARMYDISKTKPEEFSYFGKDKLKRGEAGFVINVPGAALENLRDKLVNTLKTSKNKESIVRLKDAADNMAKLTGRRMGNSVRQMAKSAFGEQADQALRAATAAVEAQGNKAELDKFIVQAGKDPQAKQAAEFAKANWDKLQPLVVEINGIHERELLAENKIGLDVDARSGYIRHAYDKSKLPNQLIDQYFGTGTGGGAQGFRKSRAFNTLYDAVAAGYGPAIKSWNAADLVESRIGNGQQMVNDYNWLEGMRNMTDPTSKLPLVTSLTRRVKPDGSLQFTAPAGYETWSPFNGVSFAVHQGYKNILNSVTSMSRLREAEVKGLPVGQWSLNLAGGIKHSMLMFDTYHAMRMTAKGLSLGVRGYGKGLSLLEYNDRDLANALKNGDITQQMFDYAKQNRDTAETLIRNGLNVGRVSEALGSEAVRHIPVVGTFNKWVFEKLTRGIMMEAGVREVDRLRSRGVPEPQAYKQAVKDVNTYFGNLGRQGVFKSKTFQDISRLLFLAPQWFESMARTELGTIRQLPSAFQGKAGTLVKGTSALLTAMFAATQVLNLITTGHPTWKNDDGHQIDAWIPGGEHGLYISPFSLPMELTHDVIRYTEEGKTPAETASQILGNKASPMFRAEEVMRTGRDWRGQKVSDTGRVKEAAKSLLPLPLPLQTAIKGQANQVERQLLASAGVKAEPAKSPTAIIANLRRQFLYKLGKAQQPDFTPSQYKPLLTALQANDIETAKEEYKQLLAQKIESHKLDSNPEAEAKKDLQVYFSRLPHTHGQASKEQEAVFVKTLTPHQKDLYDKVQQQQQAASDLFFKELQPKQSRSGFGFRSLRW